MSENNNKPYLALASAIIKRAYRDIEFSKNKKDAQVFLDSEWGKYLLETVKEFQAINDRDENRMMGVQVK